MVYAIAKASNDDYDIDILGVFKNKEDAEKMVRRLYS